MLNITEIHKNYKQVAKNLKRRGFLLDVDKLKAWKRAKALQIRVEEINAMLNKGKGTGDLKAELQEIKAKLTPLNKEIEDYFDMVPNLLHATVPEGEGAQDNVVIKEVLKPLRQTKDNYLEIAANNGLSIEEGVALAGARFNVMRGNVARLQRHLINQAIDFYEGMGYEYHYVPNLVTKETMRGTGQYPKFKEDLFETTTGLYLVPTGEVPLTNLMANKLTNEDEATRKMVTQTPCFRKEVGAYGKDTKGIIRQHQFEKVELVRTCLKEEGLANFKALVEDIEKFLENLDIQYRIIELCAKDIGFSGHKAYDFEVWFPTENAWREVATVTWCHDFQARRMGARVKRADGKKELMHTLNGTGLAVGRVLAGLIDQKGEDAFNLVNF